jgi:uncharacterized protein (TIGR02145 family)
VLKTPSNRCLARVTANPAEMYICNDGEVQIYNQIWMCSNLDVVTYRNGDTIPEVKDSKEWTNTKSGAWCYYNNDPAMGAIYGKLYNWKAVIDLRGLAPEGWHIAADSDWIELEHNLGGANVAGGKLKLNGTRENGNGLWYAPNTDATNESGFTALPAGIRLYDGTFLNVGYDTYWWLIDIPPYTSWYRRVNDYNGLIEKGSYMGENGFSVRCVKD